MSRYIDAEILKESLVEQRDYKTPNLTELINEAMTSAFRIAIREVDLVPTADVEEVKHGQWIICSDGYYPYCSNCKTEPKSRILTKYCPDCGAKMDL